MVVAAVGGEEVSLRDEQDSAKAEAINASASIRWKLIEFDFDKNPVAFLRSQLLAGRLATGLFIQ